MERRDTPILREILQNTLTRYLTVRPDGLVTQKGATPRPRAEVRILGCGGARTLYRQRRPACRSLDGVRSLTEPKRTCSSCPDRAKCTPQVRLDLFLDGMPYRLLLAYTSARNFLQYAARLPARGLTLDSTLHRIDVIHRGRWGELRFTPCRQPKTP